ncbi:MAG: DNA replication and repair protein RecF [Myxococcales bacterium]|nr:DNA replication and repair protein RecF [Myxococcales bacterium]
MRVRGFRNLQPLAFEPGSHFNVIHGDNGAGKSNLLEAIYYLGALKSFRGAKTDDLIGLESDNASLEATLEGGPAANKLRIDIGRSQRRRLQLDGKRPRSTSVWHQAVRMVLFHPGDLILASGAPDRRRAFLDRMLEQMDPIYGSTLASYEKALRSRNRLLKDERTDRRSVRAYDAILSKAGAIVGQARRRLIEDLAPRVVRAFSDVFAGDTPLAVRYLPRVEPNEDAIAEALERSFDKDRARGFTADGPHGDDLGLRLHEVGARHHGSQGQHRTIVLALKTAELDLLSERTGRVPILLLDDVSSELDRSRNRRFFEVLSHSGGQVFLTTTHPEFILLENDRVDFQVDAGRVTSRVTGRVTGRVTR